MLIFVVFGGIFRGLGDAIEIFHSMGPKSGILPGNVGIDRIFDVPLRLAGKRGVMTEYIPDDVDRQLLTLLQEDARYTAIELAEEVGVSDNTVHNRMARLEEAGIIKRYTALVDYDRMGLPLYFMFSCTARISERTRVVEEIREIPEVVEVMELMTGTQNIVVKAIGAEDEDITRVAEAVDELDVEINDENMVRSDWAMPVDFVEIAERADLEP